MSIEKLSGFSPRTYAIAIAPPVVRHAPAEASPQRLRFAAGRHLTAANLQLEALNHEARTGYTCRALNDGVVSGLAISLFDQTSSPGQFRLEPGFAIAPSGQDLMVDRATRFTLDSLPRRFAIKAERPESTVGIGLLVLTPVSARETRFTSTRDREAAFHLDQQLDPTSAPYQDPRMIDGIQLSLIMMDEIGVAPGAQGAIMRAAFLLARAQAEQLPLARFADEGVALAMLGIGANNSILWISRAAAARRGGGAPQPYTRSTLGTGAFLGTGALPPRLAQAQVDTLIEQLQAPKNITNLTKSFDASQFRHLPSAGIVPAPGGVFPSLFPATWPQTKSPIPMRQLDAVFDAAAALAPFDLTHPKDSLHWYIPVPDELFEPDLLRTPQISPLYAEAIEQTRQRLGMHLGMRNALRTRSENVERALNTDNIPNPPLVPDPDQIANELAEIVPTDTPNFDSEIIKLRQDWFAALPQPLLTDEQIYLADPAMAVVPNKSKGVEPFMINLASAINVADDLIDFGFTKVQTEIYRLRQKIMDNEAATKLATYPVLAGIAQGNNALATSKALTELFRSKKDEQAVRAAPPAASSPTPSNSFDAGNQMARFAGSEKPESIQFSGQKSAKAGFAKSFKGKSSEATFTSGPMDTSYYAVQDQYTEIFNASRAQAVEEISLAGSADVRSAILNADALVGAYQQQRTMTIAARLENPAAVAAHHAALKIKADVLSAVSDLPISVDGLRLQVSFQDEAILLALADFRSLLTRLRGLNRTAMANTLEAAAVALDGREDTILVSLNVVLTLAQQNEIQELLAIVRGYGSPIGSKDLAGFVLKNRFDVRPSENSEESDYLNSAVNILESVVSIFRALEARVMDLRLILNASEVARSKIEPLVIKWREALGAAQRDLAQARHDLVSANALFAEETARIAALAAHRKTIIATHVNAAVFTRVRHLRPHQFGQTSGRLLAGVYADPTPAALANPAVLPDTLKRMIEVIGTIPVSWFAAKDKFLAGYKSAPELDAAFHWAASRSASRLGKYNSQDMSVKQTPSVEDFSAIRAGKKGQATKTAGKIANHYAHMSQQMLQQRAAISLGSLNQMGWVEKRDRAEQELSLNDLIEGGRESVGAREALSELDNIARVSGALFEAMRQVPTQVRLLWADRLSVFDGDPHLETVENIPGFFGIDAPLRAQIASLHGWLLRRMATGKPQGIALVSDLVQVVALLSANADAQGIIAARMPAPVDIKQGDFVDIIIDRGHPTIEWPIYFTLSNGTQVSGKVRDVIENRARIELVSNFSGTLTLDTTTRVLVDGRIAGVKAYGR